MPRGVYDRSKKPVARKKVAEPVVPEKPKSKTKFLVFNRDCQNNEGWFDTVDEALRRVDEMVNDERDDVDDIYILEVAAVYQMKVEPKADKLEDVTDLDW